MLSRRHGITCRSGAILAESPYHGLGIPVNDREQHAGCAVGDAAPLFPILKSAHIQTEAVREVPPAQPQSLAKRDDASGGGVVDDPAGQRRVAPNMRENLVQRRFYLSPEFRTSGCHDPVVSFLIAATRRDNALMSAAVRSSRVALA